jgi:hypothetical protein
MWKPQLHGTLRACNGIALPFTRNISIHPHNVGHNPPPPPPLFWPPFTPIIQWPYNKSTHPYKLAHLNDFFQWNLQSLLVQVVLHVLLISSFFIYSLYKILKLYSCDFFFSMFIYLNQIPAAESLTNLTHSACQNIPHFCLNCKFSTTFTKVCHHIYPEASSLNTHTPILYD